MTAGLNGFYFSEDGQYGDAGSLTIVNVDHLSANALEHFWEGIEGVSDWERPAFAEWFVADPHNYRQSQRNSWACSFCEEFEDRNR